MSNRLPNIVYIMADDMGYGDVGCYGATKIATPNMDRVAAEGMRFTDAHSSAALCTPSRYSVLTGRYCWRTWRKRGVGGGFSLPLIDPARLTVASLLNRNGYATAAVGKWHVGWEWQAKERETIAPETRPDEGHVDYSKPIIGGPLAVGFDYFFGIAGSLDMPPYCFIENDRTVGIPSVEKDPYNPQQLKGPMVPGWKDEEVDIHHARKAVAFIERCHEEDPEQPFFLYLTPSAPHRPCQPPDFMKGASGAGARGDMVQIVDWIVGQVLDTLDKLGLADNTLVIVTSDNGARPCDVDGETWDHKTCGDLRGYKGDIHEGGHRIPLVARWPGHIEPSSITDETVGLMDLMATCAAIVGDDLPPNAAEDSCDILPVLIGEPVEGSLREATVHHSGAGMFAIRSGPWKAVFGLGSGGFSQPRFEDPVPGGPTGQLYNLGADLQETANIWLDHPDLVQDMEQLLSRYRETGQSMDR